MTQPTLLDTIEESPAHWTATQRIEESLIRHAQSYRADAEKLRENPLPDWPHGADVFDEVARVLSQLAIELRRDKAGEIA